MYEPRRGCVQLYDQTTDPSNGYQQPVFANRTRNVVILGEGYIIR